MCTYMNTKLFFIPMFKCPLQGFATGSHAKDESLYPTDSRKAVASNGSSEEEWFFDVQLRWCPPFCWG